MRILIGSDLHLGNWREFSTIDPQTGLNTRLVQGVNVMDQVLAYMQKTKIDTFVFGGDLLEKSDKVSPDVLNEMVKMFRRFRAAQKEILWVVGNHDQGNLSGLVNVARPFSDYVRVIDGADTIIYEEDQKRYSITGVAYRSTKKEQMELMAIPVQEVACSLFIGHFFVKELLPEYIVGKMSEFISIEDLPTGYNRYYFGHYHRRSQYKDYESIGALMARSFDDVDVPGFFFLELDLDTMKSKAIRVNCPLFIDLKGEDDIQIHKDHYYRVTVNDKEQRDRIASKCDGNARFVFQAETPVVDPERKVDLTPTMDTDSIIDRYVELMGGDKEFVRLGVEYAGRAKCGSAT